MFCLHVASKKRSRIQSTKLRWSRQIQGRWKFVGDPAGYFRSWALLWTHWSMDETLQCQTGWSSLVQGRPVWQNQNMAELRVCWRFSFPFSTSCVTSGGFTYLEWKIHFRYWTSQLPKSFSVSWAFSPHHVSELIQRQINIIISITTSNKTLILNFAQMSIVSTDDIVSKPFTIMNILQEAVHVETRQEYSQILR